jgi:polysaccharide biosynthesis/export protein
MPPKRSAVRPLVVVLLLLLAPALARAQNGAPPDTLLHDVMNGQLPGRESVEALRRALSVPSAESRWRGLPPFGRDLFRGAAQNFTPVENAPVGPDYVLGPGDNLVVFVSSLVDTSLSLTIDREGKVVLPRVGATFVWGLSFADAEALIRSRIASVLRNARVHVSMGRMRSLDVFVLGAVARPGTCTLSGLATAFNALAAAGGPSGLGSLRDIRVLRANKEVGRLDLYRFLLQGDRSGDVRLESGDVVYVGLMRTQVGIQGAVTRPGVYENDGPVTLRALMQLAGGATPFADLARIRIERVDANGGFRLQDLPLDHGHGIDPDSLTLSDYDLVTVLPLNERVRNVVTLDGFVRHAGEQELAPGMRLSQLVGPDQLLPEADLEHAELRRVDPHTFQVEVRPFSVTAARSGAEDVALQPLDAVTIFSGARFPRSVTVDGEVEHPGTYSITPGERLSSVLRRAGGVRPSGALTAATFVRKSAAEQTHTFLRDFVERQRLALAEQQARAAAAGDSASASALARAQLELTAALERQATPGRVVLDVDEAGRWEGTARDPELEDGDHLTVPQRPATVMVLGSVMNPGAVLAHGPGSFDNYLRLAGGASHDGDIGRSYVLRASGAAVPRRFGLRVRPGDAIIVPPRVGGGSLGRELAGGFRFLLEISSAAALVFAAARH